MCPVYSFLRRDVGRGGVVGSLGWWCRVPKGYGLIVTLCAGFFSFSSLITAGTTHTIRTIANARGSSHIASCRYCPIRYISPHTKTKQSQAADNSRLTTHTRRHARSNFPVQKTLTRPTHNQLSLQAAPRTRTSILHPLRYALRATRYDPGACAE
jgi:hypothetical protein